MIFDIKTLLFDKWTHIHLSKSIGFKKIELYFCCNMILRSNNTSFQTINLRTNHNPKSRIVV